MIKIKVISQKSRKITIRVPYFALHFASSIILSNLVWKRITHSDSVQTTTVIFPPENKKVIKPLLKTIIKEMKNHRDITIFELEDSDGRKISVRL
ncbi:hypothetical protein [Ornithinibacillus scapharcae]|uniref:hypothetical protein n=1 Tax=Ornithinibacillus scapharcae TaxID=1147159 RepID=UPI000225B888|nr:hypothetical protein [Ornithinibacillus scapharcae]